jgi:hypothetical protein
MAQVLEPDRIGSDDRARSEFWLAGGTVIFLLAATFAAGYFARELAPPTNWPFGLSTIFVALGMLCLGFGAATLLMNMRQRADGQALREEYEALARRSRTLVAKADALASNRRVRS